MTIGVQGRTHGNEDEAISAAYVLRRATSWCKDLLIVMTYKSWERGRETTTNYRPLPPYKLTEFSAESKAASNKLQKAGVDGRRESSEAYPRKDGLVLNVGKKTLMQQ